VANTDGAQLLPVTNLMGGAGHIGRFCMVADVRAASADQPLLCRAAPDRAGKPRIPLLIRALARSRFTSKDEFPPDDRHYQLARSFVSSGRGDRFIPGWRLFVGVGERGQGLAQGQVR